MPEQVQDFYPTPTTISTVMYYTGLDPRTMKPVYVATDPHEKAMQRALIQYRNPKNYYLVREALEKAGREDLIGFGKECLIRPPGGNRPYAGQKSAPSGGKPGKKASAPRKGSRREDRSSTGSKDTKGTARERRPAPGQKSHGSASGGHTVPRKSSTPSRRNKR